MISSATLFLATLVFHAVAVLGAPISVSAEIVPRSDNLASSVRFAREDSFPDVAPAIVARAIVDALPIAKRETDDIVRRFPRRFIYEHLQKRGTVIEEKVTVFEKTTKHDSPADTVAYNNGQPQNNNNGNVGPGGFTTIIGFSTTITVPGVPTPTATATDSAPPAPTPTAPPADPNAGATTPGGANPGDANPGAPATPDPNAPAPPAGPATPDPNAPATPTGPATPDPNASATPASPATPDPNAPAGPATPDPNAPAPAGGATPDPNAPAGGAAKPNGTTPTTPAGPTPDAPAGSSDPNNTANGGAAPPATAEGESRRALDDGASSQPIAKRQLAMSGAVYASSLRR